MLVFKTEIAVCNFLDEQTTQKILYHVFFITLAKVCERKHFAPKLLISCVHPVSNSDLEFLQVIKITFQFLSCLNTVWKGYSAKDIAV